MAVMDRLYLSLGIVMPWAMTERGLINTTAAAARLRQVFQNGELGLVSLMLAISVIWDLQNLVHLLHHPLGSVFWP